MPVTNPRCESNPMNDQARVLRGLVDQQETDAIVVPYAKSLRARTIAITSGKGGVGKSNLALNMAIALRQSGAEVCVLDANLGLGNIDVLCHENSYWNLSHMVSGVRTLAEICRVGPAGVRVIPGAGGLVDVADCPERVQKKMLGQLVELEQSHDYLIIDTGSGIDRRVRRFLESADVVLVITTPEPTSIADSYATIKALMSSPEIPVLEAVVNQARSREEATRILERIGETSRLFLQTEVGAGGFIPYDTAVPEAVNLQTPFLLHAPRCPASRAIEQLARRIKNISRVKQSRGDFFSRIWPSRPREAAQAS